jgi:uridine monophosphate synthetase
MAEFTEGQQELARSLQGDDAIKLRQEGEEGFRLKIHQTNPEAPLSPIYLNLRVPENGGTLTPEAVTEVGHEMYDLVERLGVEYDHIAGIPKAGTPFSEAFASTGESRGERVSQLTLHKEGTGNERYITEQVEGDYRLGDSVLLIDDLITHAGTKLEAIRALRGAGLEVSDLVVLVDREQGGVAELDRHDVETHAIFTLSQMLDLYLEEGTISEEVYQEIQDYLQADQK